LGFSPYLNCKCIRSEVFIPYWMGKSSLFDDQFEGEEGYYFYEKVPNPMPLS